MSCVQRRSTLENNADCQKNLIKSSKQQDFCTREQSLPLTGKLAHTSPLTKKEKMSLIFNLSNQSAAQVYLSNQSTQPVKLPLSPACAPTKGSRVTVLQGGKVSFVRVSLIQNCHHGGDNETLRELAEIIVCANI